VPRHTLQYPEEHAKWWIVIILGPRDRLLGLASYSHQLPLLEWAIAAAGLWFEGGGDFNFTWRLAHTSGFDFTSRAHQTPSRSRSRPTVIPTSTSPEETSPLSAALERFRYRAYCADKIEECGSGEGGL